MLKQYKLTLILTSIVILLPIPLQLLLGRDFSMAMAMPLFLLAIHLFCVYWTFRDPRQKNQGRKPTLMVLWIIPILSIAITTLDYCYRSSIPLNMAVTGSLLMGGMFAFIGNYLPKVRQNSTLGIKICWTYSSTDNWNATHRFAGRLWTGGGILIMLCALLPEDLAIAAMTTMLILLVLLPVGYSWRYYRMQKARGDTLTPAPPFSGKLGKFSVCMLIAVVLFVGIMMFTGDISYQFEEDQLLVQADFYDDIQIPYDSITGLELREHPVEGSREWGYGSARLLLGAFRSDEFGLYTRYTYTGAGCTVVLYADDRVYVLSAKDPAETQTLYETLREKTGK